MTRPSTDVPTAAPPADPPLPGVLVALGVALVLVMAAGGALISVLLSPTRIGSTLVPFGVLVAVVVNVVLASLGYGLTRNKGIAGAPVALFLVVAFTLSISPGGDTLLPGGSTAQTAVSYATLLVGAVAGGVAILRMP